MWSRVELKLKNSGALTKARTNILKNVYCDVDVLDVDVDAGLMRYDDGCWTNQIRNRLMFSITDPKMQVSVPLQVCSCTSCVVASRTTKFMATQPIRAGLIDTPGVSMFLVSSVLYSFWTYVPLCSFYFGHFPSPCVSLCKISPA